MGEIVDIGPAPPHLLAVSAAHKAAIPMLLEPDLDMVRLHSVELAAAVSRAEKAGFDEHATVTVAKRFVELLRKQIATRDA